MWVCPHPTWQSLRGKEVRKIAHKYQMQMGEAHIYMCVCVCVGHSIGWTRSVVNIHSDPSRHQNSVWVFLLKDMVLFSLPGQALFSASGCMWDWHGVGVVVRLAPGRGTSRQRIVRSPAEEAFKVREAVEVGKVRRSTGVFSHEPSWPGAALSVAQRMLTLSQDAGWNRAHRCCTDASGAWQEALGHWTNSSSSSRQLPPPSETLTSASPFSCSNYLSHPLSRWLAPHRSHPAHLQPRTRSEKRGISMQKCMDF